MKAGPFDTTGTIDQCPRGGTPLDPRPEEETSHECRILGTRSQADPVGPEPGDEYAWSLTPYLHITTSPELLVRAVPKIPAVLGLNHKVGRPNEMCRFGRQCCFFLPSSVSPQRRQR